MLLFGGTATFFFSHGTEAFGAYLSGVQNGGETINFTDGTSQSVAIPNPNFHGEYRVNMACIEPAGAGRSVAGVECNELSAIPINLRHVCITPLFSGSV